MCQGNHYLVERAVNEVNERGDTVYPTVEHTSEALVRCGPPHVWHGIDTKIDIGVDRAPAPAASVPAASTRACTPGASQACIGPGACQGGQACLADGSAFGPCDCGTRPAAPPAP